MPLARTAPIARLAARLAGCAALSIGLAAAAEPRPPGYDPVLAELGAPLYERYCASCHGLAGHGDGPAAKALVRPPSDLTAIAARRGGAFPGGEIARFIDGRFDLPAHGTRVMPIWGQRFGADVPDAGVGESIARGHIASLLEHLRSIQQPPLPPRAEDAAAD